MHESRSALLLIGFQNDYFSTDGILHKVVEDNVEANGVMKNTLRTLDALQNSDIPFINLPILFSPDYSELPAPAGLLATIKEVGAFRRGSPGGATVPDFDQYKGRIEQVLGKTGFNAFHGTGLHDRLQALGVNHVVLCGVVTSVCLDSTGRAASELGYRVTVLADCSAGRSATEHEFYCEDILPLYAEVLRSDEFLGQ